MTLVTTRLQNYKIITCILKLISLCNVVYVRACLPQALAIHILLTLYIIV